jgi:hypothetical protein
MDGSGAIDFAGVKNCVGKRSVMHRVRMMLRLQAEPMEAIISLAALAFE